MRRATNICDFWLKLTVVCLVMWLALELGAAFSSGRVAQILDEAAHPQERGPQ